MFRVSFIGSDYARATSKKSPAEMVDLRGPNTESRTMLRSEMRQGVDTIYETDLLRMKQTDNHTQGRFRSRTDTCQPETDAWAVFDRLSMRFGRWLPTGIAAP